MEDSIKNREWFKGIVLSTAFFEHYGLGREIELLSFDREGLPEGRVWTSFSIPSEAIQKLNKSLEAVDLEEQKKGLRKLLRLNRVE